MSSKTNTPSKPVTTINVIVQLGAKTVSIYSHSEDTALVDLSKEEIVELVRQLDQALTVI